MSSDSLLTDSSERLPQRIVRLMGVLGEECTRRWGKGEDGRAGGQFFSQSCERHARKFGLNARLFEIDLEEIPEKTLPVFLETRKGQDFSVLRERMDEQQAIVVLSDGRESVVGMDLLRESYTGRCLFVKSDSEEQGLFQRFNRVRSTIQQGLARQRRFSKERDRISVVAIFLNAISLFAAAATGAIVDRILPDLSEVGISLPLYALGATLVLSTGFVWMRKALVADRGAGKVDFVTSLVSGSLACALLGELAIPFVAFYGLVLAVFSFTRKVTKSVELIDENRDILVQLTFIVTATLGFFRMTADALPTGSMICGVTMTVISLFSLMESRRLVQRWKLIPFAKR